MSFFLKKVFILAGVGIFEVKNGLIVVLPERGFLVLFFVGGFCLVCYTLLFSGIGLALRGELLFFVCSKDMINLRLATAFWHVFRLARRVTFLLPLKEK